jgi:hypothetical protein
LALLVQPLPFLESLSVSAKSSKSSKRLFLAV